MYPTLETALLWQLDDSFYYGAECRTCHRSKRLSLVRLRSLLGDDFPLDKVKTRLKCSTCGSRKFILAYYTPDHGFSMGEKFKEIAV